MLQATTPGSDIEAFDDEYFEEDFGSGNHLKQVNIILVVNSNRQQIQN